MVDPAVDLCGIRLKNPVMPAAGTLWEEAAEEVGALYGAMLPKTVTLYERAGNPPPRLAEAPSGLINSIGIQNPGIDRLIENLDAFDFGTPLFVSVAGETVGEFEGLCRRLSQEERVSAVELNLSCPNVERGGELFCAVPANVSEAVGACRAALISKPLFAKLTYEGAKANALAAEGAGADALTLINTVPALDVDLQNGEILAGGLSGPAVKPLALRAVYDVSSSVGIPVIGCGGIAGGTDVAEFLFAGATAVQVGVGRFSRGMDEMLEGFVRYLEEVEVNARDLGREALKEGRKR